MIRRGIFLLLWVVSAFGANAAPLLSVDARLGEGFAQRGLRGVFVAFDSAEGRWLTNDADRAACSYLPASTFKIPNSLISLECGAIADADVVLKWDGKDRGIAAWNHDQNMREAFHNSTVWFYQELARRVGEKRMQTWVSSSGYGNADASGGIDTFWLDGKLRISAIQQIDFLVRLREGTLPFKADHMDLVKTIMVADQRKDWVLRAKTGMTLRVEHPIAWYVGWVETSKGAVYFATNFDIQSMKDAGPRIAVTYENLVLLGALSAGVTPPK